MNKTSSKLLSLFLICCLVLGQTAPLLAGPQDGQVVAGSATIRQESTTKVGITQTSDRVAINWQSFNIGANEHVQFYQPSSSSVALNRVVGPDASSIMGRLTANGQVFLVNPNGIIFGKGSQVDASGLMASTHNIRNEDFMAGRYLFNIPGKPGASVINEGIIRIADTGVAAFVAPAVANRGIIAAKLGKIALASANGFTLDFFGDQLLTFMVNDEVAKMAYDIQGNQLTSFVENSGRIEAQGGYVLLSAKAAEGVVHNVINQSGVIEATSVGQQNGEIILSGGPNGVVSNTGTLDASGRKEGETGGKVQITGSKLDLLADTSIDVSGDAGGGKAIVGGDYLGGKADGATLAAMGIALEPQSIPTASYLFMAQGAYINADAVRYGKGGKVVLWSEYLSNLSGGISAKGGGISGDGGFVETSSRLNLDIFGLRVKAGATRGKSGHWLLDPDNWNVDAAVAASFEASLNSGTNVDVIATHNVDITSSIVKTAGGDATFTAKGEFIYQHEGVDVLSGAGKLNVKYDATDRVWIGRGFIGGESNFATNGGDITFHGPNFVGVNGHIDAGTGTITILAENKESTGIDKGIWIFGDTVLTGSAIYKYSGDTVRIDPTSRERTLSAQRQAESNQNSDAINNGLDLAGTIGDVAEVGNVDMRALKGEDTQKAIVEAIRGITGSASKAQAAALAKGLENLGDVLKVVDLIMQASAILTSNNAGALASSINDSAKKLMGDLGGRVGQTSGTLIGGLGGPLVAIVAGYALEKAGEAAGEWAYAKFMARTIVVWSAHKYWSSIEQMNSAGSLLGV